MAQRPAEVVFLSLQENGAAIIEPPVAPELRELAVSLHWSKRFEGDPANQWLRQMAAQLFDDRFLA